MSTKVFEKNIEFILGDCLEQLHKIENESVDTIYLDPPLIVTVFTNYPVKAT